jgi:hypothetical protein
MPAMQPGIAFEQDAPLEKSPAIHRPESRRRFSRIPEERTIDSQSPRRAVALTAFLFPGWKRRDKLMRPPGANYVFANASGMNEFEDASGTD